MYVTLLILWRIFRELFRNRYVSRYMVDIAKRALKLEVPRIDFNSVIVPLTFYDPE